ncbi:MAG TPA: TetR family transcriptional regulator [Pseudolysinimonas sp.]
MTDTPTAIRSAAASLFAARGYAGVSVREIAKSAGVDPALVMRHFQSKEKLFLETMQLDLDHRPLIDGALDQLGERFIEFVLDSDENVRGIFLALLRASDGSEIGSQLREAHNAAFVAPLRARLHGDDAELRARLAAALVGGLLYSLWVVGDEQLLATDHRDLVQRYGGLLQSLITPAM